MPRQSKASRFTYTPSGVCAQQISFTVKNGTIIEAEVLGGCAGNSQGMGRLVIGMKPGEIAQRLKGVRCGEKSTSCPDQFARAIETWLGQPAPARPARTVVSRRRTQRAAG